MQQIHDKLRREWDVKCYGRRSFVAHNGNLYIGVYETRAESGEYRCELGTQRPLETVRMKSPVSLSDAHDFVRETSFNYRSGEIGEK